jgi:hypothetical protein
MPNPLSAESILDRHYDEMFEELMEGETPDALTELQIKYIDVNGKMIKRSFQLSQSIQSQREKEQRGFSHRGRRNEEEEY